MRAVVYGSYGEHPTVRDVPVPPCPADGALIEVGATGVCRSDWHAWQGREEVGLPHVPGHEFAGTVVEVGAEVVGWAPGAGHRPVRLRVRQLRLVPGGRPPGVRAADPAGVHPLGVVRRVRRHPARRRQSRPAARWPRVHHCSGAGLPVRDGLPGGARACRHRAWRLAGRPRLRRGRLVGGDDRRRGGRARHRRRPERRRSQRRRRPRCRAGARPGRSDQRTRGSDRSGAEQRRNACRHRRARQQVYERGVRARVATARPARAGGAAARRRGIAGAPPRPR